MTIHDAWILPYIQIIPKVLANPNGKRLPIPGRTRHTRGLTNIQVFCSNWRRLTGEYPRLPTEQDYLAVDPVFDLEDKLNTEG